MKLGFVNFAPTIYQTPTSHAVDLGEATTMTLTHENVVTTRS
jgi:hypothetical protein